MICFAASRPTAAQRNGERDSRTDRGGAIFGRDALFSRICATIFRRFAALCGPPSPACVAPLAKGDYLTKVR
jgi:hypothetical protein